MLQNKHLLNLQSYRFKDISFKQLMQKRVHNVLIICSNYDFYLLEEDGRIDEQIFTDYTSLNLRYPPTILHANSSKKALKILEKNKVELIINWLDNSTDSYKVSNLVKKKHPKIPVVTKIVNNVESDPPAEKLFSFTIPSSAALYLYVLYPIPIIGYFFHK